MNQDGASLVEVIVALVVLGVGLAALAGLTATAARTLAQARALDDAYAALESLADSAANAGATQGQRSLAWGSISWEATDPGVAGWIRADHSALASPIVIPFSLAAFQRAAP